jgi:ADP-ribose pyrophosphatase YjhB (NUDIX family)
MKIECNTNRGNKIKISANTLVFRPSVYAIIINNGKALMLEKLDRKKIFCPGGGVNPGESLEEALKREVKEETGIEIKVEKFLSFKEDFFYNENIKEAYHKLLFYYLCSPSTFNLFRNENIDEDAGTPKWLDINELKQPNSLLGKFAKEIFQHI